MGDSGVEPARPAARLRRRPGHAEDERRDRARRAARHPRRAVPRHGLRRRQADQVPAQGLRGRRRRTSTTASRASASRQRRTVALPLRLDAGAGRARRWRCASCPTPTTRATSERRLGDRDGRARPARRWPRASTSSTCSRSSSSAACATWQLRDCDPDTSEHEIDARGRARARDRGVRGACRLAPAAGAAGRGRPGQAPGYRPRGRRPCDPDRRERLGERVVESLALDDALVAGALGHPAQRERRRLGRRSGGHARRRPARPRCARSCGVDEAADELAPEDRRPPRRRPTSPRRRAGAGPCSR